MSLFDDSMAALKAKLGQLQTLEGQLNTRITTVQNLIAPLNIQLSQAQADLVATETSITDVKSNITNLQKIIDADNAAIALGHPPPSLEFIKTYLK